MYPIFIILIWAQKFDEDGSGGLDCEELQSLLELLGIEAELDKIKGIISAIDIDGKGTIDVDELVNYVTHVSIELIQFFIFTFILSLSFLCLDMISHACSCFFFLCLFVCLHVFFIFYCLFIFVCVSIV